MLLGLVERASLVLRPHRISKRIDNVAYELELPQEFAAVHPIFYISILNKCMDDPSLILPIENVGINDILCYEESMVQIFISPSLQVENKGGCVSQGSLEEPIS